MRDFPESVKYVVIGGGVHGLSTAWHLAIELEARGRGSGRDIVLLDKTGVGAGASGIACGCVRNFYMTEPLHAIIRHSVDVWMYDPVALGFQQVGYISCGETGQIPDYERLHKSQQAAGYQSDLYVGKEARDFLTGLWPDFKTNNVDVALIERVSGYAGTWQVIQGMAKKCRELGVQIIGGVEVTDYNVQAGQVVSVETNKGTIKCDLVVLGLGPWIANHWEKLGQPMMLDCHYPNGEVAKNKPMWTYWRLEEGEVYYDKPYLTAAGMNPPILHIELMNTPVYNEQTGDKLPDYTYAYFKNGNERMDRPGLQGGSLPVRLGPEANIEPYGHANDEYQAGAQFADYLTSAIAQTLARFEGCRPNFRERRNGGIGAFTPDNVPVFDWVLPNVYMIADSGHGFKMLGVGKLLAKQLMGDDVAELKPFAFSRYAEGRTFGSTNSHSPWV